MIKQLFRYKGRRIRKIHLHDWLFHHVILLIPGITLISFIIYKVIYPQLNSITNYKTLILPAVALGLFFLLLNFFVHILMRFSQLRGGYFLTVKYHDMIAKMLKMNGFVHKSEKKNGNGKHSEQFPKVYVKKGKYVTRVTLPLDGSQFHDRFLQMGKRLEEMFLADLVLEEREFGFITYGFMTDVVGNRISIESVLAKDGAITLMKGVKWHYDEMPHLLVAGGTGGGKTYFLYSLIKGLLSVGTIDICDPKNADLADLSSIPVFKGHIFYGSGDTMIRCLENGVKEMEKRFKHMKSLPNYESGKNYAFYGLPPHFIIFDEWKAFYGTLDYKTKDRVDQAVQQLVMKARQAGVFLILATQRPDAADFPAGVRDNLMCKVTVGQLAQVGYFMVFGDENKNKAFFNKKIKGRGYIDDGNGVVREFYSPYVPPTYNFLAEFANFENMIVIDYAKK